MIVILVVQLEYFLQNVCGINDYLAPPTSPCESPDSWVPAMYLINGTIIDITLLSRRTTSFLTRKMAICYFRVLRLI